MHVEKILKAQENALKAESPSTPSQEAFIRYLQC